MENPLQPRVLIVEDEAIVGEDLSYKVTALGYKVIGVVATGEEAIRAAQHSAADLVLLDLQLAGNLTGVQTAEQIHQVCDAAIVFVTAHSDSQSVKKANATDPLGYILKPFGERDLAVQLDVALHKHRTNKALLEHERRLQEANVALFESRAELAEEAAALTRLAELSSRLSRKDNLRDGLEEMLHATIELLRADKGTLQVINADQTLSIAAASGFQQDFLEFFGQVSVADDSCCGRAFRAGNRVIIEDIELDGLFAPFREVARKAGYRAVQSTPLLGRTGEPLGILSTHWRDPHRPSNPELDRLDLYARRAVDFIERIKSEEALCRSESLAQQHLRSFETTYHTAPIGMCQLDRDGRYIRINKYLADMNGIPPTAHIGKTIREIVPALADIFEPILNTIIETGQPCIGIEASGETQAQPGSQRTWLQSWYPQLDERGRVGAVNVVVQDITDMKRRQEALRESEERLKLALQSSRTQSRQLQLLYELANAVNRADALPSLYETAMEAIVLSLGVKRASILTIDEHGIMRFQAWRGLSDSYRAAVEGHTPWKVGKSDYMPIILPDVSASEIEASLRATILQEGIQALAFIPLTYGGRLIGKFMAYFDQPHAMANEEMEIACGIANTLAIGIERKRAEEALRASEERYRSLVTVITDVPWTTDANGAFVSPQPAWEAYTGQSWEDYKGFGWVSALHPDDRERVKAVWLGACETKALYESRGRLWHAATQQWRFYIGRGTPLLNDDGTVRQWVGAATDVDDARRMTEALREGEERLRLATEGAHLGMWFWDVQKDDLVWTGRCKALFGLPEAVRPLRYAEFLQSLHPDDRERTHEAVRRSNEERVPYDIEYRALWPDGSVHWIAAKGQTYFDEQGRVARMHGIMLDIDDRKRTEEALLEAQKKLQRWSLELERAVTVKTAELLTSQKKLRALATELNLAEQRERKRLAMELHDHLQQILVLGKLTIGQGKRYAIGVPDCENVLKKVDDVLSDALTYTRTLVADLSPPALRDHGLAAGLKCLAESMKKHNLIVTVKVPEDPSLTLPEDQTVLLFQSARELLINASKHAGTGQAVIEMAEKQGRLEITVRDEGGGFDLAAAAAAAAADSSSSGEISSKFGLFSIRERMKAMGGWFDIQSSPSSGTCATLVLPLPILREARVNTQREIVVSQAMQLGREEIATGGVPIRVLLVDDHAMVRQGLRAILESYSDIAVVGDVPGATEAFTAVDLVHPQVVIMDINMPGKNGIEATSEMKTHHPDIQIIGLSVNAGKENQEAMLKAGAAMLLTKEAAVEQLHDAIQQVVNMERVASPSTLAKTASDRA